MLDDASRRTPDIDSAAKGDISPPTGAERSRRQQETARDSNRRSAFPDQAKVDSAWIVLVMAYQMGDG